MPEPVVTEEQQLETELNPVVTPKEQAPVTEVKDSGTPKVETPEDPEFDLGVDEEQKPLKLKRSQILEFKKGSMLQADYTKKTQEIATQKEELKEMSNILEHLKANPKKADRIIAILDEKEAAAEAKVDEIDEILKSLPDDDPYAKTLRALKAQNQALLKTTQELQTKLGGFEQKTQTLEQGEAQKQAEQVLTKTLDSISGKLKFEDEEDKGDWKKELLTYLVNNPKKYETEEAFVNEVNAISAKIFEGINKRNERVTARYIKSKGGGNIPAHPAGGGAAPAKSKPTMANLEESIVDALKEESGNNQT